MLDRLFRRLPSDVDPALLAGVPAPHPFAGGPRVLLELRPAFEGFAGIPQETRLLFRGLQMLKRLQVQGLIQHGNVRLSRGTEPVRRARRAPSAASNFNQYSRLIVSMGERPLRNVIGRQLEKLDDRYSTWSLLAKSFVPLQQLSLSDFDAEHFGDFVWRTMFAKTLPAADFAVVAGGRFKVCSTSWRTMHKAGLTSLNVSSTPVYPSLDTRGMDIFIAQTPYPARVSPSTALVVRYHDAIPIFMPHLIPEKALHQASHMYALTDNVRSGAHFACVSEATRQDLLKIFPQVAQRSTVIHNMVAAHYFAEEPNPKRVSQIVRERIYAQPGMVPEFISLREQENFYRKHLHGRPRRYLLAVSTIEPRKNHLRLLAGWEAIKARLAPDLRLVVVGTLGWDNEAVRRGFAPWLERGELYCLNAVPAGDLRVLYRNAAATVCPSISEGFDYSGVEAMASGGVVIASDIAAHREVYDDAAVFFDPNSTASLADALERTLLAQDAPQLQQTLRKRGAEVAARYTPERILPQWERLLARVHAERRLGR